MKRFIILVTILSLLLGMQVTAYDYPAQVWKWNDLYTQALETGDDGEIITNGLEVIRVMEGASEGAEKTNMLRTRLTEVGNAYARQGNYDAAAQMFRKYLTYSNPEEDWDGWRAARAKALQYASQIRIFTDGGDGVFFDAKNEHQNGVLYGVNADGDVRSELSYESMVLLYQELGDSVSDWTRAQLTEAAEKGLVVEFALNCPNHSLDIQNITNFDAKLEELSQLFSEFSKVKILLRFGAEFNEWSEPNEGEAFVAAFRYAADYFKHHDNVAMVWNPLQEGKWYLKLSDFYPGDEYVDWIGLSAYSNVYHMGDPNMAADYEVVYKTGDNADPVLAVQEVIETFAQNKPVLISESGFSHRSTATGENTMEWAIRKMDESYSYLPMVYPQIKGICHFDRFIAGELNDYNLQGSLKEQYLESVKNPRMIQRGQPNTYAYRELKNGSSINSLTGIYTYAHIYGENTKKVTYYIDGQWAGESTDMPFGTFLEFGEGAKELRVVAEGEKGKTVEKTFILNASEWNTGTVSVVVNGGQVVFDQSPVLYNDRTLVPVRAVFEALGASVTWDELTKTVTGTKGDRVVKLVLGSNIMRVNEATIFLDVPAISVNNRTLVPARAIAEGLGATVEWLSQTGTVVITSE